MYAQDQDVSPDGRTLYVSRGHRGDVAASGHVLIHLEDEDPQGEVDLRAGRYDVLVDFLNSPGGYVDNALQVAHEVRRRPVVAERATPQDQRRERHGRPALEHGRQHRMGVHAPLQPHAVVDS